MVVKYRRKVINDEISEYLKHRFVVVGQAYGINCLINSIDRFIHIMHQSWIG